MEVGVADGTEVRVGDGGTGTLVAVGVAGGTGVGVGGAVVGVLAALGVIGGTGVSVWASISASIDTVGEGVASVVPPRHLASHDKTTMRTGTIVHTTTMMVSLCSNHAFAFALRTCR